MMRIMLTEDYCTRTPILQVTINENANLSVGMDLLQLKKPLRRDTDNFRECSRTDQSSLKTRISKGGALHETIKLEGIKPASNRYEQPMATALVSEEALVGTGQCQSGVLEKEKHEAHGERCSVSESDGVRGSRKNKTGSILKDCHAGVKSCSRKIRTCKKTMKQTVDKYKIVVEWLCKLKPDVDQAHSRCIKYSSKNFKPKKQACQHYKMNLKSLKDSLNIGCTDERYSKGRNSDQRTSVEAVSCPWEDEQEELNIVEDYCSLSDVTYRHEGDEDEEQQFFEDSIDEMDIIEDHCSLNDIAYQDDTPNRSVLIDEDIFFPWMDSEDEVEVLEDYCSLNDITGPPEEVLTSGTADHPWEDSDDEICILEEYCSLSDITGPPEGVLTSGTADRPWEDSDDKICILEEYCSLSDITIG